MALYQGDEGKFTFELKAEGFDMERDDFEVEIVGLKGGRIVGVKNPEQGDVDVLIFSKTEQVNVPAAETQEPAAGEGGETEGESQEQTAEPVTNTITTWFCIFKTDKLTPGNLKVVVTGRFKDPDTDDAVRTQSAVVAYPDQLLTK